MASFVVWEFEHNEVFFFSVTISIDVLSVYRCVSLFLDILLRLVTLCELFFSTFVCVCVSRL